VLKDDKDKEYNNDEPLISILFIDLQLGEEGYSNEDYMD